MKNLYYYLFDMTGDGITDLCISDEREFVYVISYDEEKKRLTLWNGFDSTWIKLNGTCAGRWDREGINQIYYEFEPNGELFRMTGFMEKELNNIVNAVGNYNSIPTSVTSAVYHTSPVWGEYTSRCFPVNTILRL